MKNKDHGLVMVGIVAIIAIVIMVLLVKSMTGNVVQGGGYANILQSVSNEDGDKRARALQGDRVYYDVSEDKARYYEAAYDMTCVSTGPYTSDCFA